jgi:hypothetical protein
LTLGGATMPVVLVAAPAVRLVCMVREPIASATIELRP